LAPVYWSLRARCTRRLLSRAARVRLLETLAQSRIVQRVRVFKRPRELLPLSMFLVGKLSSQLALVVSILPVVHLVGHLRGLLLCAAVGCLLLWLFAFVILLLDLLGVVDRKMLLQQGIDRRHQE